jgi:hypothetical protein
MTPRSAASRQDSIRAALGVAALGVALVTWGAAPWRPLFPALFAAIAFGLEYLFSTRSSELNRFVSVVVLALTAVIGVRRMFPEVWESGSFVAHLHVVAMMVAAIALGTLTAAYIRRAGRQPAGA